LQAELVEAVGVQDFQQISDVLAATEQLRQIKALTVAG